MIVVVSPLFMKVFTEKRVAAITLFPFIILRRPEMKKRKKLINHEKIHIQQQLELLIIGFYIWYLLEYVIRLLRYQNHYSAYRQISFEQEAYDNEDNPDYLANRKLWAFCKKDYFKD